MTFSKTIRNFSLIALSNAAPSIVAICALPVLTRLFAPQAFGQWAIFQSLLFIPGALSSFRYELAVVVEKEDRDADAAGALVAVLGLLSCLVVGTIFFICDVMDLVPIFGFGLLALACLAASFVLSSLLNLGSSICIRNSAFGTMLQARFFQAVTSVLMPMALSYWWQAADVLILGTVAGMLVGALLFSPHVYRSLARFLHEGFSWIRLVAALKTNRAFAHFTLPYTLVTQAFGLAVTSLLAINHGSYVLGQFNLMSRTLTAPTSILVNSLGQLTVRPLVHHAENRTAAARPIFDLVLILLAISLPLATVGTVYGEPLFVFIFGSKWSMAGRFAEWAAIPMCLQLSVAWIDRLFDAWREQRFGFLVGTAGCAIWLSTFSAAEMMTDTPLLAIAGWCLGVTLNAAVWGTALVRLVGFQSRVILPLLPVVAIAVGPVLMAHALTATANGTYAAIAMGASVLGAYGGLFAFIRHHQPDLRLLQAEGS